MARKVPVQAHRRRGTKGVNAHWRWVDGKYYSGRTKTYRQYPNPRTGNYVIYDQNMKPYRYVRRTESKKIPNYTIYKQIHNKNPKSYRYVRRTKLNEIR